MPNATLAKVVEKLRTSVRRTSGKEMSDGHQLERFVIDRDETALAELIRRHGPMVFGVCRRILAHHADAEDAFQATFLVLVRKAHQVNPPGMIGPWLHGVARRTAVCARKMAARRRESFGEMADMPSPTPHKDNVELLTALDEQILRLPDKYRIPVVLCELEGRTIKQVAHQLRMPQGTIASRLHRGRELLAQRMKKMHPACGTGTLPSLLANQANSTLPAILINTTAKIGAATALGTSAAIGISSHVAQLTEGVMKLMLLAKIKTASATVVAFALMVGGGFVLHSTNALATAPPDDPPVAKSEPGKKPDTKPVSKMQGLWNDLAGQDDVKLTKAVLALAAAPKESLPMLQTELRPVKFDAKKVQKWIADIGSDKPEVTEAAARELDYIAPLIQDDLNEAIENAANGETRQRLLKIMLDLPDDALAGPVGGIGGIVVGANAIPALPAVPAIPVPPPPPNAPPAGGAIQVARLSDVDLGLSRSSWKRAVRAVTILEHIGSSEAVATIKKIADGESDAAPTKAAKAALTRLEKSGK